MGEQLYGCLVTQYATTWESPHPHPLQDHGDPELYHFEHFVQVGTEDGTKLVMVLLSVGDDKVIRHIRPFSIQLPSKNVLVSVSLTIVSQCSAFILGAAAAATFGKVNE